MASGLVKCPIQVQRYFCIFFLLAHTANCQGRAFFREKVDIPGFFLTSFTTQKKIFMELRMSCFVESLYIGFVVCEANCHSSRPITQHKTIIFSSLSQNLRNVRMNFTLFKTHIDSEKKRFNPRQ